MSKTNAIPIQGSKLREEFAKRQVSPYEFGVQCGYSRKWIKNAIDNNYVSSPMVVALKDKLNISLDDLKKDEEKEKKEEHAAITQGDLYETINDAVLDAFRSAKAELQRVMYDAMKDALGGG